MEPTIVGKARDDDEGPFSGLWKHAAYGISSHIIKIQIWVHIIKGSEKQRWSS